MFPWLTPEVRKALYGIASAALVGSIALGWISAGDVTFAVETIERAIAALITLMAFLNTHGRSE